MDVRLGAFKPNYKPEIEYIVISELTGGGKNYLKLKKKIFIYYFYLKLKKNKIFYIKKNKR